MDQRLHELAITSGQGAWRYHRDDGTVRSEGDGYDVGLADTVAHHLRLLSRHLHGDRGEAPRDPRNRTIPLFAKRPFERRKEHQGIMSEVYGPIPLLEQRIAHPSGEKTNVHGAASPDATNGNGVSPAGYQALVDNALI